MRVLAGTVFQPCFGTHKEESRSEEFMTKTSTKTKERCPCQVSTVTQGWKFWISKNDETRYKIYSNAMHVSTDVRITIFDVHFTNGDKPSPERYQENPKRNQDIVFSFCLRNVTSAFYGTDSETVVLLCDGLGHVSECEVDYFQILSQRCHRNLERFSDPSSSNSNVNP